MRQLARTLLSAALLVVAGCANPPAPPAVEAPASAARLAGDAPDAADAARLVPLQGALNVRTLAGLPGEHGVVPAGAFIRAADLSHLTAADRDALVARGVALDVDLRTVDEETQSPDALANDPRVEYVRVSLLGTRAVGYADLPPTLGELYVETLAQNQAELRQVFQAIAAQKDGTVLFHCTAGKDRTGMIAAILLALAGVPEDRIVHDYAVSAHYLRRQTIDPDTLDLMKKDPKVVALMGTPPQAMTVFLDTLRSQYGGAYAYLRRIGVSELEVRQLLARLGQD